MRSPSARFRESKRCQKRANLFPRLLFAREALADTKNAMSYAQAAATVAPKSRPAPATRQVALDEARAACDRALAPHLAMSLPVPAPAAPPKPPPNRPPPAASAAAGAGTAAATRLPKSPPGAAAAAPQHAGAAQTPPKPLAAGRAGTGTAPKLDATPCLSGEDMAHGLNSASKPKPTPPPSQRESKENTARTERSDFLDALNEAEAKDEAKAKTKSVKVATSATKKAGKEPAAAKKKTPVTAVTACSKQSSAAP